jgi:hypothetical protein
MDESDDLTAEVEQLIYGLPATTGSEKGGIAFPDELPVSKHIALLSGAIWTAAAAVPVGAFVICLQLNLSGVSPEWPYDRYQVVYQQSWSALVTAAVVAVASILVAIAITRELRRSERRRATNDLLEEWFEVIDVNQGSEGISLCLCIDPVAEAFESLDVKFELKYCSWLDGSSVLVRDQILTKDVETRRAALARFRMDGLRLEANFPSGSYTPRGGKLNWGYRVTFRLTPLKTLDPLDQLEKPS